MHKCVTAQMVLESARTVDVLIRLKMRWSIHPLERALFRDAENAKQRCTAPERAKLSTGVLTSRSVVGRLKIGTRPCPRRRNSYI